MGLGQLARNLRFDGSTRVPGYKYPGTCEFSTQKHKLPEYPGNGGPTIIPQTKTEPVSGFEMRATDVREFKTAGAGTISADEEITATARQILEQKISELIAAEVRRAGGGIAAECMEDALSAFDNALDAAEERIISNPEFDNAVNDIRIALERSSERHAGSAVKVDQSWPGI